MENSDNSNKPFRILSLDGGGIRGLITALILQEVEKQLQEIKGESLLDYFDMIAGTSTGSLLAAGIATKKQTKDMIDMYEMQGKAIFPYCGPWSLFNPIQRAQVLFKYGLSAPKYDNEGLCRVLKKTFQQNERDILLKEVGRDSNSEPPKPILLILAYDTLYRNTTFFTNYHTLEEYPKQNRWFYKLPLWKICASSASAPTFFPGFELSYEETLYSKDEPIVSEQGEPIQAQWSYPHVDGGVTANNPSLCAISRALDLGYKLENISLLSIGTGKDTEPYDFEQMKGWGLLQWATRITNVFMAGQGEVQDTVCRSLMGGQKSNRYLRLQFDLNQTMYTGEDLGNNKNLRIYHELRRKIFRGRKIHQKFDDKDILCAALQEYAQLPIIPASERKNQLTRETLDNDMSNAEQDNIEHLKKAAQKYINAEESYVFNKKYSRGSQIKEAIKNFILSKPQEVIEK